MSDVGADKDVSADKDGMILDTMQQTGITAVLFQCITTTFKKHMQKIPGWRSYFLS